MAQGKYKLHVKCDATKNAMSAVVNLKYLFRDYLAHAGQGTYGFWFDSPEERATAQTSLASAYPDATFETVDPGAEKPAKKTIKSRMGIKEKPAVKTKPSE